MTIQAWTFLVSRNQSIDYKTVVAPDFIFEAKIRSLLAKATEEDFTESGRINIREVKGSEVGNLTIVFRSVKARNKDIGEQGNEVLKDSFGREIYWIEGLVFQKDLHEIQYKIGESHLKQTHRELQDKYSEFWHEDKLSISHVINLLEVPSEPDNNFSVLAPLVIAQKPQLPEHRLPGKQERKNYFLSKLVRSKANLFRVVLIVFAALLLIGISGIWLRSQQASICLYMTQYSSIDFNSKPPNTNALSPRGLLVIEELKILKKEHETAWIWLTGSLKVEKSLADQIKDQIKKEVDKQKISNTEITLYPNANDPSTLNIKNHPIDFAIALLQNQKVISGNLNATIVEPISSTQSSCKLQNSSNP